jgi:cobalamin biosynthesis protein CbiG
MGSFSPESNKAHKFETTSAQSEDDSLVQQIQSMTIIRKNLKTIKEVPIKAVSEKKGSVLGILLKKKPNKIATTSRSRASETSALLEEKSESLAP